MDVHSVHPVIRNLKPGRYATYIDNEFVKEDIIAKGDGVHISVDVDGKERDVVILQL